MEERNDVAECDKIIDEVMLPGFRFHPTDEELVGFYLRRKVQHKPLSIELIKQLDIYKYDPWDLPKLATTGEKEWYFYCPRDRKYRNSARPNRVTGAGFWKATGTDRPIYSSEGSKCIGLKKSLVFYKGRAAKGIKTDWMMHEFRLPSVSDSVPPNKRYLDKNIPANEAWAICRIFKKANSSAQRAISHSWVSPAYHASTTTSHDTANPSNAFNNNSIQFSSSNITSNTSKISPPFHFGVYKDHAIEHQSSLASFSPSHFLLVDNKPFPGTNSNGDDHLLITPSYTTVTSNETSLKCATNDASSLLLDMSASVLGDLTKGSDSLDYGMLQDQWSGLSALLPEDLQENLVHGEVEMLAKGQNVGQILDEQCGAIKSFPYGYQLSLPNYEAWKSNLVFWDSSPCPSELSTSYSTNKCYT